MAPLPSTLSKQAKEKGTTAIQSVEVATPDVRRYDESILFFTPYAWAKLKFMCHTVGTEIGGMGISSLEDPLLIEDIRIIKQSVSQASVSFDPEAYAAFCLEMCDPEGEYKLKPINCQRVWIHTHPENMSFPSSVDEENFRDSFGCADWAIMFIMPRSGDLYVRMRARVGDLNIISYPDVALAWHKPFPASDHDAWLEEIKENVTEQVWLSYKSKRGGAWEEGVAARPYPRVSSPTKYSGSVHDDELGFGFGDSLGIDDTGFTPAWWETEELYDPVRRHSSTQSSHTKPKPKPKKPAGPPSIRVPKSSILYPIKDKFLSKLVRHPIKLEELTEELIDDLESSSIHLVGDDANGNALFQCVDGNEVEHTVNSDRLLFIQRFRAEQPVVLEDLEEAERDLKALAGDRKLGDDDMFDIHNQPIEMVYPWRCLDGTELLLSQSEWDLLDDVRDGRSTIEAAYLSDYSDAPLDVPSALYSKSDLSVGQEVLILEKGHPKLAEVTSVPPKGDRVQITLVLDNGNSLTSMICPEEILEIVTPSREEQNYEEVYCYGEDDIDIGDVITVTLDDRRNPEEFISGEACSVDCKGVMVEFQMEDGSRQIANIPYSHIVNVESPLDDDEDDDDADSFLSPEAEKMQTGFFFFNEEGSFLTKRHERAWQLIWPVLQEFVSEGKPVEELEERLDEVRRQAVIDGDWQEFDQVVEAVADCGYSLDGLQKFMNLQLKSEGKGEPTAYDVSEAIDKGEAV